MTTKDKEWIIARLTNEDVTPEYVRRELLACESPREFEVISDLVREAYGGDYPAFWLDLVELPGGVRDEFSARLRGVSFGVAHVTERG